MRSFWVRYLNLDNNLFIYFIYREESKVTRLHSNSALRKMSHHKNSRLGTTGVIIQIMHDLQFILCYTSVDHHQINGVGNWDKLNIARSERTKILII